MVGATSVERLKHQTAASRSGGSPLAAGSSSCLALTSVPWAGLRR